MTRIAIIAQSDETGAQLAEALRRHGFRPQLLPAADGATALQESEAEAALVELSGATREVLEAAVADKDLGERLPLLAVLPPYELTAYGSGATADDFIVWPGSAEELAARLRIVLRRRGVSDPEHILRRGDLVIDFSNYRVSVAGRHVELTFKEYELLRFLAGNPDKVFTREALLNRVWGYDYYGGARTVDVHIRRLRAKIEDGHRTFIETIRNVGYRFREGP